MAQVCTVCSKREGYAGHDASACCSVVQCVAVCVATSCGVGCSVLLCVLQCVAELQCVLPYLVQCVAVWGVQYDCVSLVIVTLVP